MTSSSVKKTENMLPATCTRWATPALESASVTIDRSRSEAASTCPYAASSSSRSCATPAAVAIGFPDSVPAW
ncbi:hypothetical protein SANTM175S_01557 [Streptomyces antimycoticus]